jgi:hypothetical protein
MKKLLPLLLISALFFTSCATIFKGSTADIMFNSAPSGAQLLINGINRGVAPSMLSLNRSTSHQVTMKMDGYEDVNFLIDKKFDFATTVVGNLFSWSLLGVVVDIASGAAYTLTPSDVQGNLRELKRAGFIDETKAKKNEINVVFINKSDWDNIVKQ